MNIDKTELEKLIREILTNTINQNGVKSVKIPAIPVRETDRLDTGNPKDSVYTRDVLTLEESPRLGCGIMEMTDTTFDWTLKYDEIDYVIEGSLSVISNGVKTTANKGEIIFIPKDSKIQFSVDGFSRFLYVTYPANWSQLN